MLYQLKKCMNSKAWILLMSTSYKAPLKNATIKQKFEHCTFFYKYLYLFALLKCMFYYPFDFQSILAFCSIEIF